MPYLEREQQHLQMGANSLGALWMTHPLDQEREDWLFQIWAMF
jgi:hypothetical protein